MKKIKQNIFFVFSVLYITSHLQPRFSQRLRFYSTSQDEGFLEDSQNGEVVDSIPVTSGAVLNDGEDPPGFPDPRRINSVEPTTSYMGVWLSSPGIKDNPCILGPTEPVVYERVDNYVLYGINVKHDFYKTPIFCYHLGIIDLTPQLDALNKIQLGAFHIRSLKEWRSRPVGSLLHLRLSNLTEAVHPFYPPTKTFTFILNELHYATPILKEQLYSVKVHWRNINPDTGKETDYFYIITPGSIQIDSIYTRGVRR